MSFLLDKKNQTKCGNIIVWIILIAISIVFSIFATIPATREWISLRIKITDLTESSLNRENDISRNKSKLSSIEAEFNNIAKDFLKEERLLFPEFPNTNQIAKILELYSLQYSLINNDSKFELNSVSFSRQESENYIKTSTTISITSSEESLLDFIYFIQNNQLPEKLLNAQSSLSSLLRSDVSSSKFLRENILPIANIESINSSKADADDSFDDDLLNTNMQINFFSQKTNNA